MATPSSPIPTAARSTDCPRRVVLKGAAGLVLAWLTPVGAFTTAQEAPPVEGDWLVRVGDDNLVPLTTEDVPYDGHGVMVWPLGPKGDVLKAGTPNNRIILARLNPRSLTDETRARAVDDIVAYSAICTHNGCEVDTEVGGSQTIFCSCHQTTFDPRDSGSVISGPAPRRLPALPIKVADGRLVVAGGFTSPPGFNL